MLPIIEQTCMGPGVDRKGLWKRCTPAVAALLLGVTLLGMKIAAPWTWKVARRILASIARSCIFAMFGLSIRVGS